MPSTYRAVSINYFSIKLVKQTNKQNGIVICAGGSGGVKYWMSPQTYRVRICILTRPTGDIYGHSSLRSTDAAPFRVDRNIGEMICQWKTQIMEIRIQTAHLRKGRENWRLDGVRTEELSVTYSNNKKP